MNNIKMKYLKLKKKPLTMLKLWIISPLIV